MTTMTDETSTAGPARSGSASRILIPEFWAAVAIVGMWLAVLFDGIYGGDFVSSQAANFTRVPSAVFVAFFAFLATWAVAKRAFGRSASPK
jgi:hypothetical protein